jgi:hypothetical protein
MTLARVSYYFLSRWAADRLPDEIDWLKIAISLNTPLEKWRTLEMLERRRKQMTHLEHYTPGPASGAKVKKDGPQKDKWTLILVRELRHSPEKVWQALTDPAQLREWAPFVTDENLGAAGRTVNLTWVGSPKRSNQSDESRRSLPAGVWRYAVGARGGWQLHAPDFVARD